MKPGECRLDAQQICVLAQGGSVSAYVGRDDGKGQVHGARITLVPAAPPPTAASQSRAVARVEAAMILNFADDSLEHGRVRWVPPGWGLAWFDRGLWLKGVGVDGEWTKSRDLDTHGVRTLEALLPAFCKWVTRKTGVSLPDEEIVR